MTTAIDLASTDLASTDLASTLSTKDMSRAAARKMAVAALDEIAAKHGATVERNDGDRETVLHLHLPRAYVMIDVDAATARIGASMGHWVAESDDRFRTHWQGGNWPRPHHKATTCVDMNFGVFLAHINRSLRQVASGAAFAVKEAAQ